MRSSWINYTVLITVCCILLVAAAFSKHNALQQVVIVSIDGLRPTYYLEVIFHSPTLKTLVANGAWAKGAQSIYPSVTYPSHTSIVTGVMPAKHGIWSNTLFTWQHGPSAAWHWYAKDILVPTLWQRARAAGKTTALIRWPVGVGADVDWNIPEIFAIPSIHHESSWEIFVRHTNPELLKAVFDSMGSEIKELKSREDMDEFAAHAAEYIQKAHRPDLMLVHLINVDHMQHSFGPDSDQTGRAVTVVDAQLKRIVDSVDLKTTSIIVTGDHGFFSYTRVVNINTLFTKEGWIGIQDGKIREWRVIAHTSGGQAAIYSRDRSLDQQVIKVLKRNAGGRYTVLDRQDLDRLGAYPEAICAIEAMEGYTVGDKLRGDLVVENKEVHGEHGYLPTHPKMLTGFIASGAGVKAGLTFERVHIVDIAPTVAKMLGFTMPPTDGKALELGK